MPKKVFSRSAEKQRSRFENILDRGMEAPSPCKRCVEKKLKCLVELSTGFCAYCIRAKSRCSLVLTNTERREMRDEQRAAQLRIARAEAELAAARVALLEAEEKERIRELEDIVATEELGFLEKAAGIRSPSPSPEPVTRTAGLDLLDPEPSADLGWLQADFTSFVDPSFLAASFAFLPSDFEIGGSFGDNRSPGIELPVSSGA
jgi:hypothetical protein